MEHLVGSVGRGGKNRRADVIKVQKLINASRGADQPQLAVDGVAGPVTVQAIENYQRQRLGIGTPDGRIDPGGRTLSALNGHNGPQANPVAPAVQPQGTVQAAMDYFTRQGWSDAQAAGIVANLVAESNLQPNARGDGGHAYGLAQWHRDRQNAFSQFSSQPIQGSSFESQLEFVQHELTSGNERNAGTRLQNAATATDAGSIISRYYERPADEQGEATRRGQRAENILRGYSAQPAPATH